MIDLKTIKKIHFVGIGGIGVSAVARMFLLEGKVVSGSDRDLSVVTEELAKMGAAVYEGHLAEHVPADADLIVYTIAVPVDNPERARAQELNIPELSYPEMIGLISRDKFTIAIAGTHGKTTTTAMIAKIMIDAGLDPTVIVGSLLKDFKSNFIAGNSKYFIVEACEYRRSFLNLSPNILVITNIDEDHLDYYKDIADIQGAFVELISQVEDEGVVITDVTNKNIIPVLKDGNKKIIDYKNMTGDFILQAPGAHNVANAKCALAVAGELEVPEKSATKSLADFSGTWRRFDFLGETKNGVLVYDDYAHHPHEVEASLAGFREKYPDKKIIVIFQPHLYSRTRSLLNEFAKSFSQADEVVVAPIYAAREPADPTISNEILAQEIGKNHANVSVGLDFETIVSKLKTEISVGEVVVVMGAGDIVKVGQNLLQ